MYKKYAKRTFDFFFALLGLILLSPILFLISLAVLLSNGLPVFFFQNRPGHKNVIFKLYKFRSMTMINSSVSNLPDSARITRVGSFLRDTSLDELPSLINVLKGDMSLVGPRPLLEEYLLLYTPTQARRHEVKPGITGWAQINGRNTISWEEKFQYDVWYVDHQSFILDIRILYFTLLKVLKREGINSSSHVSMEKYEGSK